MGKNKIKLTESQLRNVIREAIGSIWSGNYDKIRSGKDSYNANVDDIRKNYDYHRYLDSLYSSDSSLGIIDELKLHNFIEHIRKRMPSLASEIAEKAREFNSLIDKHHYDILTAFQNEYRENQAPNRRIKTLNNGKAYNPYTGKYEKMTFKEAYQLVQKILHDDDFYLEDLYLDDDDMKYPWHCLEQINYCLGNDTYDRCLNDEYRAIYGDD